MKEDKFILICIVCLVIFCKIWAIFTVDASDTVEKGNVSITEDSYVPQKEDKLPKNNVIGCGASFSSENTANMVNGKSFAKYSAKNVIKCRCNQDGTIVEKAVVYQYSAKPDNVELDCNSKCIEVCANN